MRKSGLPTPHPRPEVQQRGSCPTLGGSRRVSAPPPPHSPQSCLMVQSQGEKMLLVPPPPLCFPPPPFCPPDRKPKSREWALLSPPQLCDLGL